MQGEARGERSLPPMFSLPAHRIASRPHAWCLILSSLWCCWDLDLQPSADGQHLCPMPVLQGATWLLPRGNVDRLLGEESCRWVLSFFLKFLYGQCLIFGCQSHNSPHHEPASGLVFNNPGNYIFTAVSFFIPFHDNPGFLLRAEERPVSHCGHF